MSFEKLKEKMKEIEWKAFFKSRSFIIVCCVLIAASGVIVWKSVASSTPELPETQSGTKVLGNAVLVGSETSAEDTDADMFFASAVINREKTRCDAMDVLQTIADSPDSLPNAKEDALRAIASLVDEMNAEANIEMLVRSKGFDDCVAVFSEGRCSVIVKCSGLLEDDVAQILSIAVEQTGLSPSGINIIEKN